MALLATGKSVQLYRVDGNSYSSAATALGNAFQSTTAHCVIGAEWTTSDPDSATIGFGTTPTVGDGIEMLRIPPGYAILGGAVLIPDLATAGTWTMGVGTGQAATVEGVNLVAATTVVGSAGTGVYKTFTLASAVTTTANFNTAGTVSIYVNTSTVTTPTVLSAANRTIRLWVTIAKALN